MTELHVFLTIGLWFVGTICFVAFFVYLFDAPEEIIYSTIIVGVVLAIGETLHGGREQ